MEISIKKIFFFLKKFVPATGFHSKPICRLDDGEHSAARTPSVFCSFLRILERTKMRIEGKNEKRMVFEKRCVRHHPAGDWGSNPVTRKFFLMEIFYFKRVL